MNARRVGGIGLLAVLVIGAAPLHAADDPAAATGDGRIEAETVSEFQHTRIVVAADGTSVRTVEQQLRFVTDNAARVGSHVMLGYEPRYGTIEVLEAFTLRQDGSRIAVPAGSIQTQNGRAMPGAYNDSKTIQIEFPQVEAGGAIAYRFRETTSHPRLPGQFQSWNWFSDRRLWRDVTIELDAPQDAAMTVAARDGSLDEVSADGRHRWRWHYASPDRQLDRPETSSLFAPMLLPGLSASTLQDYAQLAALYRGVFYGGDEPKSSAKVQALAEQLTQGVDDPAEQVHRLYDWVRLNVRYVQLYLGDGGLRPHEVEAVIATRFGDCKDHAALLGALLAAKGIASTPVLIGAGRDYALPQPPQMGIFNHVITWIPLLNRYVDSTARYSVFEQLPGDDLGVPVVHLDDGSVHQTPPRSVERDRTSTFTTLTLAADGSASGSVRVLGQGADSIPLRAQFETLDAAQRADYVRLLLLGRGLVGDGDFTIEPGLPPQQYAVTLRVTIRNLLNADAAGALLLEPLLSGPQRLFDVAARGQRYGTRRYATGCQQVAIDEHYALRFPPGDRLELPRDGSVSEASYRFDSTYRRDAGQGVLVDRHYTDTRDTRVCEAAEYPAFHRFSSQLMADLRRQIVYRPAAAREARSANR